MKALYPSKEKVIPLVFAARTAGMRPLGDMRFLETIAIMGMSKGEDHALAAITALHPGGQQNHVPRHSVGDEQRPQDERFALSGKQARRRDDVDGRPGLPADESSEWSCLVRSSPNQSLLWLFIAGSLRMMDRNLMQMVMTVVHVSTFTHEGGRGRGGENDVDEDRQERRARVTRLIYGQRMELTPPSEDEKPPPLSREEDQQGSGGDSPDDQVKTNKRRQWKSRGVLARLLRYNE